MRPTVSPRGMRAGLALLVACAAPPTGAQTSGLDVETLLAHRYGLAWTPAADERARWSCPEGRLDAPSGRILHNWVCRRPAPRFTRLIVWRASAAQSPRVERDNFRAMAGGPDAPYGEPDCTSTDWTQAAGAFAGTVRRCRLPLPNGVFHVAFAHLTVGGAELSLVVRNAHPQGSTPRVGDDLLSWLAELSPIPRTETRP